MDSLLIKELSLKEKIAQLFLIGFHGSECVPGSAISDLIQQYNVGGVILFDKNMVADKPVRNIESPEQLKKLTNGLQSVAKTPLLIGIDQEGGLVNRLKPQYGFPKTKSHKELGEIDDLQVTRNEARLISNVLKEHGININFAPCVDLAINPNSSIIAKRERCFGTDAKTVIKHAEPYIDEHNKNDIITACKHFPGHGSAEGDTHQGFVDVSDSWSLEELEPYEYFIAQNQCSVIMTSHIFNRNFDSEYPATLSRKTLTDLLRGKLGFKGVLVSDDMQMKAISDHYTLKESLQKGLEAGVDIFCFGNNLLKKPVLLSEAIQTILDLIETDKISISRIDESVERILNLKKRFLT